MERARERRGSRNRVCADGACDPGLPGGKTEEEDQGRARGAENRANHHLALSGSSPARRASPAGACQTSRFPRARTTAAAAPTQQHAQRPLRPASSKSSKQAKKRVRQIVFATPALVTRQRIHGPLIGHDSNLAPVPPETEARGPAGCSVSKHPRLAGWRPISTRRGMRRQDAGCLLPWSHGSKRQKGSALRSPAVSCELCVAC